MATEIQAKIPVTCEIEEEQGILLVEINGNLTSEDFAILSGAIDPYYKSHGQFNGIILNSKKFPYWKGNANFKEYVAFARDNHFKFKKVALTMGGFFPKVVRRIAGRYIEAEVNNFGYDKILAAQKWIWS